MPKILSAAASLMFQRCRGCFSRLSGFGTAIGIHLGVFFTDRFAPAQIFKLMDQLVEQPL